MKGILMKPDMNLAIRELRKTVSRRLDHLKEINLEPDNYELVGWSISWQGWHFRPKNDNLTAHIIKPRYLAGETVYVKEAHYAYGEWHKESIGWVFYRDEEMAVSFDTTVWKHALKGHQGRGWYRRSPLFLPTKDARTFLKIESVRPERLQEITEADALAEGIEVMHGTHQSFARNTWGKLELTGQPEPYTARYHYEALWDSINPDYPFSSNPWVWRIEFSLKEVKE